MAGPCCNEPDCRRSQPIRLYLGDLSGQVYAVTRARVHSEHGDGPPTMVAMERHDITRQFRAFLKANRAWVMDVLSEERDEGGGAVNDRRISPEMARAREENNRRRAEAAEMWWCSKHSTWVSLKPTGAHRCPYGHTLLRDESQ